MGKTVSVYLDDLALAVVDRFARIENRSRSSMIGEVIRRYAQLAASQNLDKHPLSRNFSAADLNRFLREDRKLVATEAKRYRKVLGLD